MTPNERSRQFALIAISLIFSNLFFANGLGAWSGKVVGVIDGDSIKVLHDGRQEQIRLWGIDCPEKRQDFGTKAKQATSALVFQKIVDVDPVTKDRYGRTVAFVRVVNSEANEELIRQGLASVFTRYCDRRICVEWKMAEEEAREAKQNLWSLPNAVPPWEFRGRKRLKQLDIGGGYLFLKASSIFSEKGMCSLLGTAPATVRNVSTRMRHSLSEINV